MGVFDLKKSSYFEILKRLNMEEEVPVTQIDLELSWRDLIMRFLKDKVPPFDRDEAMKLKHQAPHYMIYDEKLYKRSYSLPLLSVPIRSKLCSSRDPMRAFAATI